MHVTVYVEIQTSFQKRTPKDLQNRAHMDPKLPKMPSGRHIKKSSKNDTQNEPKLVPKWGPKVEPKSPKMMSWVTSAQEWLPSGLQTPFKINFGGVLGRFADQF